MAGKPIVTGYGPFKLFHMTLQHESRQKLVSLLEDIIPDTGLTGWRETWSWYGGAGVWQVVINQVNEDGS